MIAGKKHKVDAFEISKLLEKHTPGEITVLDEVGSTNTVSLGKLESGEMSAPFVTIARKQSAGHGRLGRKWFSEEGATLCLSVAVPLDAAVKNIESFTVRAGVSICRELSNAFASEVFLKWPNDIYSAGGKKIAGMLAELKLGGFGKPHIIVFGVGINYDLSIAGKSEIPAEIKGIAADIKSVSKESFSINELAAAVIKGVLHAASSMGDAGLVRDFERLDWLKDREVVFNLSGELESGIARGIDGKGRMVLELCDGSRRALNFGEATTKKDNI